MADSKLTALAESTAPVSTDIVYVVVTPGGTPAEKKVTLANLLIGMEGIRSEPPSGGYQITNIYMNASHEMVIEYKGTAEP